MEGMAFSIDAQKYKYQGKEKHNEFGLGWYSFDLRAYNPVIARWHNADPYNQYSSPYIAMGNNPVNMIDPNGGESVGANNICKTWEQSAKELSKMHRNYMEGVQESYMARWGHKVGGGASNVGHSDKYLANKARMESGSSATAGDVFDALNSGVPVENAVRYAEITNIVESALPGNADVNIFECGDMMTINYEYSIITHDNIQQSDLPGFDLSGSTILNTSVGRVAGSYNFSGGSGNDFLSKLMNFGIDPSSNVLSAYAGLKYTSQPFRTGYWRGANGNYYSLSLAQNGGKCWVVYQNSANIAKSSVKWLGRAGNFLGYLNLAYNGANFFKYGDLNSGIETAVGVGSMFLWEIGAFYYGGKTFYNGMQNHNNTLLENGLIPGKDDFIIWK